MTLNPNSTIRDLVVGVGDCKASATADVQIVTYALGSCLGITAYDARRRVGGLLHAMLPDSTMSNKGDKRLAMFVDTGMGQLVGMMRDLGADVRALEFKAFGAAKVLEADRFFRIGDRNTEAFRAIAGKYNLRVSVWEVGGNMNRTIKLQLSTGQVKVRMPNQPEFMR